MTPDDNRDPSAVERVALKPARPNRAKRRALASNRAAPKRPATGARTMAGRRRVRVSR